MMLPMSPSPLRATLAKDPREVAGMFDAVARRYDLSNDVMSLFQVHMWRQVTRAAVAAGPGMRVLDLAAGTGTSSVEYAADGARGRGLRLLHRHGGGGQAPSSRDRLRGRGRHGAALRQ